jgi:glycerophosphoryl diester phosphodiesterase
LNSRAPLPNAAGVRPLVIAHRGASGTCPENTLAAFRRAAALGADMIELDAQETRDGEVVVLHDDTLDRTTDGRGRLRDRTLAELRGLDAGAWFHPRFRGERVPTLTEVLAAVPLPVNVELKPAAADGALEARTLARIEAAGALSRVVFSSFDAGALERLRARSPAAALAVLWQSPRVEAALRLAERVAATALHLRKEAAVPEARAAAAAAGLPIRVWTVNEPAEFARFAAANVEGVFTDHPERFLHNDAAR